MSRGTHTDFDVCWWSLLCGLTLSLAVGLALLLGTANAPDPSWPMLAVGAMVVAVAGAPLLLVCTAAVWAIPSLNTPSWWIGPLLAWIVAGSVASALGPGWRGVPGMFLATMFPSILMVGFYALLRRSRERRRRRTGRTA